MIAGFHHAALAAVTQLPSKHDDGVIDVDARFIEDSPQLACNHEGCAPVGGGMLSREELARRMGFTPPELEEPGDGIPNWGPREPPQLLFVSPPCAGFARPLTVIDVDARVIADAPLLPAPAASADPHAGRPDPT